MTKAELISIGLPEEKIREFQDLYHRDLQKAAKHLMDDTPKERAKLREAITAMLPMVKQPQNLKQVLAQINYLYWSENKAKEKPAEEPEQPETVTIPVQPSNR